MELENRSRSYIREYLGQIFAIEVDDFFGVPPYSWRAILRFEEGVRHGRVVEVPTRFDSMESAMAAGEKHAEELIDAERHKAARPPS